MTWYKKTWAWLTRNFKKEIPIPVPVEVIAPHPQPPPPVTIVFLQERGTAVFIPIAFSDGHLISSGSVKLDMEVEEVKALIKSKGRTVCLRGFLDEDVQRFRNNDQIMMTRERFENHLRDR